MTKPPTRCAWCKVPLRSWQTAYCRKCRRVTRKGSLTRFRYPPCSRRHAEPDRLLWPL